MLRHNYKLRYQSWGFSAADGFSSLSTGACAPRRPSMHDGTARAWHKKTASDHPPNDEPRRANVDPRLRTYNENCTLLRVRSAVLDAPHAGAQTISPPSSCGGPPSGQSPAAHFRLGGSPCTLVRTCGEGLRRSLALEVRVRTTVPPSAGGLGIATSMAPSTLYSKA